MLSEDAEDPIAMFQGSLKPRSCGVHAPLWLNLSGRGAVELGSRVSLRVMDSLLDSGSGGNDVLLERMKRALVEKHGERIEELQRTVATQEAELEALQTQFSENVAPPEDWRNSRQAVDDGDDQAEDAEEEEAEDAEDADGDDEEAAGVELQRVLERPRWRL